MNYDFYIYLIEKKRMVKCTLPNSIIDKLFVHIDSFI
jgi:hypothetical protein